MGEQPRAIEREEDTQKPKQREDKSGILSQQQQGAAAEKTFSHYSVDATVTCQRPAPDATTRLRQWLSSMGACETELPLPQGAVQHPAQEKEMVLASPSNPLLSTDCLDKDDDSGAPDVVAHIIIRTVPDSVKN